MNADNLFHCFPCFIAIEKHGHSIAVENQATNKKKKETCRPTSFIIRTMTSISNLCSSSVDISRNLFGTGS